MLSDNLLSIGQIGLIAYGKNCQNGQICQKCAEVSNDTGSNCPLIEKCFVLSAVSNYTMMGQLSVQLFFNGQHCVFVKIYALFIGQIWFKNPAMGRFQNFVTPVRNAQEIRNAQEMKDNQENGEILKHIC